MKKHLVMYLLPLCSFGQDAIEKATKEFCACIDKAKISQQFTERRISFVMDECAQQTYWNHHANFKKAYKIKYSEDSLGLVTQKYYESINSCPSYQKALALRDATIASNAAANTGAADTVMALEQGTSVQVLSYETKAYLTIVGIDQATKKQERYTVLQGGSDILERFIKDRSEKIGRVFMFFWEPQKVFDLKTGEFEDMKVLKGIQYI